MRDKIQLNVGNEIKRVCHRTKGPQAETDIYEYNILDSNGVIVGSIVHTEHTSLNGFQSTQSVVQKDDAGKVLVDIIW